MTNPNFAARLVRPLTITAALLGTSACATESASPLSVVHEAEVPGAVEFQRLLEASLFLGPIAVPWERCPKIGEPLPPLARVHIRRDHRVTEIDGVRRIVAPDGSIDGWCGESVGTSKTWGINSDIPANTVVVIGNCTNQPDCEEIPSEYDPPLGRPEQNFSLEIMIL